MLLTFQEYKILVSRVFDDVSEFLYDVILWTFTVIVHEHRDIGSSKFTRVQESRTNSNSELESVYAFKRRSRSLSSRPPSPVRQPFLKQRFSGLIGQKPSACVVKGTSEVCVTRVSPFKFECCRGCLCVELLRFNVFLFHATRPKRVGGDLAKARTARHVTKHYAQHEDKRKMPGTRKDDGYC